MKPPDRVTERQAGPPATLADDAANGFGLTPICRRCWHVGETRAPEAWADALGVPMTASRIAVQARLTCGACGERAAYFHIENPAVKPRT